MKGDVGRFWELGRLLGALRLQLRHEPRAAAAAAAAAAAGRDLLLEVGARRRRRRQLSAHLLEPLREPRHLLLRRRARRARRVPRRLLRGCELRARLLCLPPKALLQRLRLMGRLGRGGVGRVPGEGRG